MNKFRFQLTIDEDENWRSQFVTSSWVSQNVMPSLRSQSVTLETDRRGQHRKAANRMNLNRQFTRMDANGFLNVEHAARLLKTSGDARSTLFQPLKSVSQASRLLFQFSEAQTCKPSRALSARACRWPEAGSLFYIFQPLETFFPTSGTCDAAGVQPEGRVA